MVDDGGRETKPGFERALRRLKSAGCNLLVHGNLTPELKTELSRTYLGSPDERRRRLLVLTDAGRREVDEYLPVDRADLDESRLAVVRSGRHARSASAVTTFDGSQGGRTGVGGSELADSVVDAVAGFSYDAGRLAPGELRVAFDSLMPVLRNASGERALRSLSTILFQVRGARGMGHYYAATEPDSVVVAELRPLFDATIEIRRTPEPVQKWRIPRYGVESGWMDV